jgi:Sec-independent protein secretion pathway component TatC
MHALLAATSTATGTTSFLNSSLGQLLQTATRILAFPVGLYFVWVIIRHGMKQRHRDILLSVVFGGLVLAVMADLTIITGLISFFTTIGNALVNFFSSL